MKKIVAVLCAIALLLGITACGEDDTNISSTPSTSSGPSGTINTDKFLDGSNESKDTSGEQSDPTDLSPDLLNQDYKDLIETLHWTDSYCGVAYVGYVEGPMGDGYGQLYEENGYMDMYSFLADIPNERLIESDGYELYCIVPASLDYFVSVSKMEILVDSEESVEFAATDLLYESETGEPFLLLCNKSEIFSDVWITITTPDGTEKQLTPYLSGMDSSVCGITDDGLGALDFTPMEYDPSLFASFDELVGDWMTECYPNGVDYRMAWLTFYYDEFGERCVEFWYGPDYSEMDVHYLGYVSEDLDENGNWNGGYLLDMHMIEGLLYQDENVPLCCSYTFQFVDTERIIANHYGDWYPLMEEYENDWLEFWQVKE